MIRSLLTIPILTLALAGCGEQARQSVDAGTGPAPTLLDPIKTLFPTVRSPTRPVGLRRDADARSRPERQRFAGGLQHPRWLLALPNATSWSRERLARHRQERRRDQGFFQNADEKGGQRHRQRTALRCCATPMATASPNDVRPFSPAFIRRSHGVGRRRTIRRQCQCLCRFPLRSGASPNHRAAARRHVAAVGYNHHWTKSLSPRPTAKGSTSASDRTACRRKRHGHGKGPRGDLGDRPEDRCLPHLAGGCATRLGSPSIRRASNYGPRSTSATNSAATFSRLHHLGPRRGFYGWPYSYTATRRQRIKPPRPDLVASRSSPIMRLAPTRIARPDFSTGARLGPRFASGAFIGQHGSWNRKPPAGYRVIFVPFAGAQPSGMPVEVLTGSWSTARPTAARSEFKLPATARCSSPMMSATRWRVSVRADRGTFPARRERLAR